MIFIQLTGLSGAGKSTLSFLVKEKLMEIGYEVEVIDGDEYRKVICRDLGFSKEDRQENIRRLAFIGNLLSRHRIIVILSAINPYESVRSEVKNNYPGVYTIWLDCPVDLLIKNDIKGLYRRALLPDLHPEKIGNFTGISDIYENPENPDYVIHTHQESISESADKLLNFILNKLSSLK